MHEQLVHSSHCSFIENGDSICLDAENTDSIVLDNSFFLLLSTLLTIMTLSYFVIWCDLQSLFLSVLF